MGLSLVVNFELTCLDWQRNKIVHFGYDSSGLTIYSPLHYYCWSTSLPDTSLLFFRSDNLLSVPLLLLINASPEYLATYLQVWQSPLRYTAAAADQRFVTRSGMFDVDHISIVLPKLRGMHCLLPSIMPRASPH